ncbi:F0F1 ATP synthase subunit A [Eubacterium oxidoreducens]|uniref:F0F1 ATP synthase subunit A n=1 Tax=Eubacterium oxidoreducens TaxID=1732 RepID=UPI000B7E6E01|nr:F0F1 ATP synthase subunit A [Eubacterium oxidoreducens]
MRNTEELISDLTEQLNCGTAFTIPLFGGLEISESVVVTWGIMAFWIIFSICITRNLRVHNPSKRQIILEACFLKIQGMFDEIVGKNGRRYIPYLMAVMLYIGTANILGIFGFKPPTKDLSVTIALAVMSIVLVEYSGIHKKGVKGWLKGFTEPVAIITPINIIELFIRPFSLCLRLFGNVIGAFVIMELIKAVVPIAVPVAASLYFDIFDGFIQAYVFVFLTSLYIREMVVDE